MRIGRMILAMAILSTSATPASEQAATSPATKVRAAAISFVPKKFDLEGNAAQLEKLFREAAKGGARIAVAPEGALDGYVVNEIIAEEVPVARMNEVAIPIDGPVIGKFRALAAELRMCLVFGFAERIGEDVFNCAVFIDDSGLIRGKYHKMQLAEGYHDSWWFNRLGTQSRAFDTPYGRCGIMICNDRWNPDLARIPVLDGARFLIIPSYGSRSAEQDEAVLSRARENGVPIIEANVGVTLLVDNGAIEAVDRAETGITYGEITIPPPASPDTAERDRVEKKFLSWRTEEMVCRLEKTQKKNAEKKAANRTAEAPRR